MNMHEWNVENSSIIDRTPRDCVRNEECKIAACNINRILNIFYIDMNSAKIYNYQKYFITICYA